MASTRTRVTLTSGASGESINDAVPVDPNEVEIAGVAYQLWLDRGCPNGSDQEDWFRAEELLKLK
jgi:hypothetical protein